MTEIVFSFSNRNCLWPILIARITKVAYHHITRRFYNGKVGQILTWGGGGASERICTARLDGSDIVVYHIRARPLILFNEIHPECTDRVPILGSSRDVIQRETSPISATDVGSTAAERWPSAQPSLTRRVWVYSASNLSSNILSAPAPDAYIRHGHSQHNERRGRASQIPRSRSDCVWALFILELLEGVWDMVMIRWNIVLCAWPNVQWCIYAYREAFLVPLPISH